MRVLFMVILPAAILLISGYCGLKRNIALSAVQLLLTTAAVCFSSWLTPRLQPQVEALLLQWSGQHLSETLPAYIAASAAAQDMLRFLSTLAMPMVFQAVLLAALVLSSLIFLAVNKLLSGVLVIRAGKRAEPLLKAGSVLCAMAECVLVMAFLALPLGYYGDLALAIEQGTDAFAATEEDREVLSQLTLSSVHPTNRVFVKINSAAAKEYETFNTQDCQEISVRETVVSFARLCSVASAMDRENPSADELYEIADTLQENAFLNETLTDFASDMFEAWGRGEAFLGQEPVQLLGSSFLSGYIYSLLSDCEDISELIRLLADAKKLGESFPFG